ncbi:MAG TPA: hypothetical protein PK765_05940 [bacterium]|nr:hypothetical protein [bacterium]
MKSNAPLDRGSIEAGLRVQTLSQDRMSVFLRSPDERAFLSFRRSIEKKLSKTYDLPPDHRNLLLLFVVYTPITTNTDFKEELLREPIVLPGNAQFSEVWYMQIRHISSKTPDPLVIEKFTDI